MSDSRILAELEKLAEQLEKIDNKLEGVNERLTNLDVTSAKQEVSLENHIRRTEIAEESIEIIRGEMQPIKKHIHMVEGAFKLLGGISLVAGIVRVLMAI